MGASREPRAIKAIDARQEWIFSLHKWRETDEHASTKTFVRGVTGANIRRWDVSCSNRSSLIRCGGSDRP